MEHASPLRGIGQLDWPGGELAGAMRLRHISRTRHEDFNVLAKSFEVRFARSIIGHHQIALAEFTEAGL
jgi:uncharacterized protein (DUF305 family)